MREIPLTKLVKNEEHGSDMSSYNVVHVRSGEVIGEVFKAHGQPTWTLYVAVNHPQYGEGISVAGYRRTRTEAVEKVVTAWQAGLDEIEAHRIHDARTFEAELPTSLDWERRVKELAEELGRAQAHAIPNSGLHYWRVDNGELLEETIFAARSLRRQRDKVPFDVDALRTAAFAYQFAMNASHQRALADVKHHTQAVVFTAGMREVENVWES